MNNAQEGQEHWLLTYYRQDGNWLETGEPWESFCSFDDAKKAAEACEDGDYGVGEFIAVVRDGDGNTVYSHEWQVDPNQDRFDETTWLVTNEEEFQTSYFGIGEGGEFFMTVRNGGHRGAFDRQDGEGRWSEMADPVEEISLMEFVESLVENGRTLIEAAREIEDNHSALDAGDVLLDVADEWNWTDQDVDGVLAWIEAEDPAYALEIQQAMVEHSDYYPTYAVSEFTTPPEKRGQMVTRSYGYDVTERVIVERCHDASDNTTYYTAYADPDPSAEWEPWNGAPKLGGEIGLCRVTDQE